MDREQELYLEKLYREMYGVLLSFADAALDDKAIAEESVQDTFRIACTRLPEFCGSENPQGWLMLTLKNVIWNTRRETAALNRLLVFAMSADDETVLSAAETGFNKNLEDERDDFLCVDSLSPDEYSLLKKIVLQRRTVADAARELGISLGSCKERIQREKKKLRKKLEIPQPQIGQQREESMNNGRFKNNAQRNLSRFEELSIDDLRYILHQNSMLDEGVASDTEAILAISEILADKEQKEAPVDVDAAWAAFQKDYRPFTSPEPLYALDAKDDREHPAGSKRPRLMKRLIGLAAVIALILAVGTVTAYGRRYDLAGYVAKWSRDTFRFVNAEKTSVPFYNMSAALSVDGITEPLVPRWLPEGYGEDNARREVGPLYVKYVSRCYIGENTVSMTVSHYNSEYHGNRVYETDPTVPPEVYEAGGVEHHLMMNGGYWRALWRVGDLECSILGKVSLKEMKRIVDSIYE